MPASSPLPRTNPLFRLFCRTMSPLPVDAAGHRREGETLVLDLARSPELAQPGGALRLEDASLPDRILVVHGVDGELHAYRNHCACGGFRVDPVPGEPKIRCCTLMQSTYDYSGKLLKGTAKKDLDVLPLTRDGDTVRIDLAGVAGTKPAHERQAPAQG
jgi:nitrite reductase/ring-hydroxylating ferredoxin subunit